MTLLVGINCSDGIVIAADRQATHGTVGRPTIAQEITKIIVVSEKILFGASGHKGLGQQLAAIVEKRADEIGKQRYHLAIKHIQKDFREIIDPALQTAQLAVPVMGSAAVGDATCGCLLGAQFKDGLYLVEITPRVAVERMDQELSFISIGAGKDCADSFLGFLKDVYWPGRVPTRSEGALAAFWTVKHAIKMKVPGVGYDADVFVLEPNEKTFVARKLENTKLLEHEDFIKEAENRLRSLADELSGKGAPIVSTPPTMT